MRLVRHWTDMKSRRGNEKAQQKKNFLKSIKNLKKGVDFFCSMQYNTECTDEVTKKVNIKRP